MLTTSAQIAFIRRIQGVLSTLALLNMNGYLFSKEANVSDGDTYDHIVVGGSGAGAVVAARLVEKNCSVLVIEAGGNGGIENIYPGLVTYIKNSYMDWNFTAEKDILGGGCHEDNGSFLGKVLGGSGGTNYMLYGRGNPRDYEKFYKATKDSSYKWENMLKYFKRSENLQDISIQNSPYKKYHSTTGKIGVTKENRSVCDDYLPGFEEAGESLVVDNIGAGTLGYSTALYYILEGHRTAAARAYLSPLKENPKLHLTRNSMATKICFDKNKNAVGVEFVKDCKTITVKARKEVIVSAGPVKSPQLLMLSGIGPKEVLGKFKINVLSNIPVGKNYQNVVGALLGFKTNRKADPKPFNAHDFPAPLIIGYSALNKSSRYPDYQTENFIIDDAEYFLSFCGFTLGFKASICDRLYSLAKHSQMMVTAIFNINPKSCGEIILNSTDPFEQPKLIPGYYSDDEDLECLVDSIIDFLKIEGTPHFQDMGLECLEATKECSQFEFGSREYWKCYALCMLVPSDRQCGTCSMGSVVDNKLNVIGVNRLRVVDASVMPNPVGGAVYASVIALAEKTAEMIIESSKM